jgi:hypothetical protein
MTTLLGILLTTMGLGVCIIGFSQWVVQTFDINFFVDKYSDQKDAKIKRFVPKGTHKMIKVRTDFIVKLHTPTLKNWSKGLRFKG